MAIQHPDIQPAVNHSVQVAIAGAEPVRLMMANYLGQMGIDVLVVEKLDKLIDYPRTISIDDEALRTMQSVTWSRMFCRTLRHGTRCVFSPRKAAVLLIFSQ